MRLSAYSDYSIRVLMLAPVRQPERVTVEQVAEAFGISRHHLVKVVHDLGRNGYLRTQRGVGGGFTLARASEEIRLGDVVRLGEESESVIDCTGTKGPCRILPACRLRAVLDEAAAAFFSVLDECSLADLVKQPAELRRVLSV